MPGPSGRARQRAGASAPPDSLRLRLDRWLFQARFFRSREAAAAVITGGHLRLNGQHCLKPAHGVGVGDVLTFVQAKQVRVVRIHALGTRRGPAEEARGLYQDLSPAGTAADTAPGDAPPR